MLFFLLLSVPCLMSDASKVRDVTGVCFNNCNGHGLCNQDTLGRCECYNGWGGVDCSQRSCPANRAWVDIPSEDNIAHRPFTECSNMVSFCYLFLIWFHSVFQSISLRVLVIDRLAFVCAGRDLPAPLVI
jgi:hypothetical protein